MVDHAECAVLELHHYNGGVHIAVFLVACTGERCTVSGNLGNLAACQIADHVEIVNGHVHEDTAGNLDIAHRLVIGITGGDLDEIGLA